MLDLACSKAGSLLDPTYQGKLHEKNYYVYVLLKGALFYTMMRDNWSVLMRWIKTQPHDYFQKCKQHTSDICVFAHDYSDFPITAALAIADSSQIRAFAGRCSLLQSNQGTARSSQISPRIPLVSSYLFVCLRIFLSSGRPIQGILCIWSGEE